MRLPMFPLGTVLFPYALLPLHVFEERYRIMTRKVLADTYEFGVVLIERGSEVGGGDVRFDVGTIARVVQAAEMPDGRYALATVGTRRIRVVQWLPDDPYPLAEVEPITDPPADDAACALREHIETRLGRAVDPDPVRASYEVAATAGIGPLDAQRLLEAADATTRLRLLADVLDAIDALGDAFGDDG